MSYLNNFKQAFCVFLLFIISSCSYKDTPRYYKDIPTYDVGSYLTWTFFGNEDDGIYGEKAEYLPDCPNDRKKALRWWMRNPCHNFCFYVIGSADRVNSQVTLLHISKQGVKGLTYSKYPDIDFAFCESNLFLGLHGGKPFFFIRIGTEKRSLDCYIGWRDRGNFGLKCVLRKGTKNQ